MIVPSEKYVIESVEGRKKLVILQVSIEDSGSYRLRLENEHGKCQHTAHLIITGQLK